MVFSSLIFLYVFLPACLAAYHVMPRQNHSLRNYVLLGFSLLFYFYGEPRLIWVLLLSISINYLFGLGMDSKWKKVFLILAVCLNIGQLVYFKYSNFFIRNLNQGLGLNLPLLKVLMPIGISFYTFQAMSYVIDSYRNPKLIQRNPFHLGLYIVMFPQLIAGPIVRYEDVAAQINRRTYSLEQFSLGINRFIQGLAKKVLLANAFADMADQVFTQSGPANLSIAWFGALAYTLQIYYDFSGYSDMAIGLGRMLGFEFLENFNYPYVANSITDFWRRWHISLSTWFRDYVYIPLGGNRRGFSRQVVNILVVWLLTGFWHGAEWTFIIWGLYFAALLIIEKLWLLKALDKHGIFRHVYALFFIVLGWVIFRSESLSQLGAYLGQMFTGDLVWDKNISFFLNQYKLEILAGLVFSMPVIRRIKGDRIAQGLLTLATPIILILVTLTLLQSSYNPFIYFRF